MPVQYDNLVLIIGTNPLPDYVAAQYFIAKNTELKTIWLIHSAGNSRGTVSTKQYAENLHNLIKKKKDSLSFRYVGLNNIESISETINDLRNSIKIDLNSGGFHVNLTGGTKTMGIAVYDYFKETAEFSYLSARDFRLFNENGVQLSGDLRNELKISLEEIITLHGYQSFKTEKKEVETSAKGYIAPTDYNSAFNTQDLDKYFYDSLNNNSILTFVSAYSMIRDLFVDSKGDPYSSKDLIMKLSGYLEKENTFDKEIINVFNILPERFKIFDNEAKPIEPMPNKNQLKLTLKYIDGKWFEKYVLDVMNSDEYFADFKIYNSKEIYKSDWNDKDIKFELDIIVIYGYQLYVISVTTSIGIKLLKNKAFEVINRAKQIGGQEARCVLISLANNTTNTRINKQMPIETGSGNSFMSLGIDDIKKDYIKAKLKEFIKKEK